LRCQDGRSSIHLSTWEIMTTSKNIASQADKDLRDPKTLKKDCGAISSDLAQAKRKPKKGIGLGE
jgi:hypothetical protein